MFAHTRDLQGISGSGFTEYTAVQGGECWMLHKSNIQSFSILQQEVKKLMDTLGYQKEYIKVREVLPLDYIITPVK